MGHRCHHRGARAAHRPRAPNVVPYRIQADLAAVHATALDAASTDWLRIVALYDELLAIHPSPIVALNRAVAVGMSDGPLAGLRAIDAVAPELPDFHLVPAARGELLARAGRPAERDHRADRAIGLAPYRARTTPAHPPSRRDRRNGLCVGRRSLAPVVEDGHRGVAAVERDDAAGRVGGRAAEVEPGRPACGR